MPPLGGAVMHLQRKTYSRILLRCLLRLYVNVYRLCRYVNKYMLMLNSVFYVCFNASCKRTHHVVSPAT